MPLEVEVRRLLSADAATYRAVRLEALRLAPEAFSATLEGESAEPLSWFAARLDRSAVFGAFASGELVGVAGWFERDGPKQSHKGVLVGMYVRPGSRRAGIGRRLVGAVVEDARGRVELLQLSVVSGNEAARRLYARLGFVEYGVERNALKRGGLYWDEILMAKPLVPEEALRS